MLYDEKFYLNVVWDIFKDIAQTDVISKSRAYYLTVNSVIGYH